MLLASLHRFKHLRCHKFFSSYYPTIYAWSP